MRGLLYLHGEPASVGPDAIAAACERRGIRIVETVRYDPEVGLTLNDAFMPQRVYDVLVLASFADLGRAAVAVTETASTGRPVRKAAGAVMDNTVSFANSLAHTHRCVYLAAEGVLLTPESVQEGTQGVRQTVASLWAREREGRSRRSKEGQTRTGNRGGRPRRRGPGRPSP